MNFTNKELKQFKTYLLDIELQICDDLNIKKIDSSIINRYAVSTIYGVYSFYFTNDSIIGKFENIKNYILPDKYIFLHNQTYIKKHSINQFSGKFNFHYSDIYDFLDEIYKISLQFQD